MLHARSLLVQNTGTDGNGGCCFLPIGWPLMPGRLATYDDARLSSQRVGSSLDYPRPDVSVTHHSRGVS